jgi:hypothetical protein
MGLWQRVGQNVMCSTCGFVKLDMQQPPHSNNRRVGEPGRAAGVWRVHLPVNDDGGDEGKKATTVIDRASGWAMHLAEGVQHESWAFSLSWAPRSEEPISLTALHPRLQASTPPRLHSYCSSSICALYCRQRAKRDKKQPSWGDALGWLLACKFCVGCDGRSCMRPGRVMGCFGCFTMTGLAWERTVKLVYGRETQAFLRERREPDLYSMILRQISYCTTAPGVDVDERVTSV